jgi:hypothetical protein
MQRQVADRTARRWNRRQVLLAAAKLSGGVAGLAAAGYAGYHWPHPQPATSVSDSGEIAQFHSRPDLSPPRVTVALTTGSEAPAYIFAALKGYTADGPGQQGPMILDTRGRLVWFQHSQQSPMNLRVQQYQDQPVLTWWEGQILNGYGEGSGIILDASYRQLATVKAGNGLQADLHEFLLTPQAGPWLCRPGSRCPEWLGALRVV